MAKKNAYAWVICALCCLNLLAMSLATNVSAVYQPFIIAHNGLTNAQASALITVRAAVGTVAMLFVNKVIAKLNIKATIALAVFSSAIGFGVYSLSTMTKSYALYCVGAGLQGIAYGLGSLIPVTILISRWFKSHKGLAMGIASAGTGVASLIAPPIITKGILNLSLQTTFLLEAGVILLLGILLFVFLHNDPAKKGLTPYEDGPVKEGKQKVKDESLRITGKLSPVNLGFMLMAAVLIGCINTPSYAHISVLFTNEGFSPEIVATLMSLLGIVILGGKMLFGAVSDRIGIYRSNFIFYSMYVIGLALCALAFLQKLPLGYLAMVVLGLGYPVGTTGLSMYGLDMAANPEEGAKQVKRFQIAYMIGTMVFSSVPGIMADAADGSYVTAFVVMCGIIAVSMVIVQATYATLKRRQTKAAAK